MVHSDWKTAVPADFSGASRVWIYQSGRRFTAEEVIDLNRRLRDFVDNWVSHNRPVKGWAGLLFDQFIVFMADDTMDRLCGSAIDGSIRFIKVLEGQLELVLMDRLQMAFLQPDSDQLVLFMLDEVEAAMRSGRIQKDALFFNNAVTTKDQMLDKWLVPLQNSFLWTRFSKEYGA